MSEQERATEKENERTKAKGTDDEETEEIKKGGTRRKRTPTTTNG